MFKRILLPYDFSPSSEAALALARKHYPDAALKLLHVVDPKKLASRPNDHFTSPIHAGEQVDQAEEALRQRLVPLMQPGDEEAAVLIGTPADRILWAAEHWHPELILMGTHGRTGLAHLFVGSVTEEVVRKARVPVLVTKDHARSA